MNWKIIIISGGQPGANRAALDFAITHGLPHGGWCKKGLMALDGPLAGRYQLKETDSDKDIECMESNVRDSDATVVFTLAPKATGGSQKSLSIAKKLKKPCLHLHPASLAASEKLLAFLEKHHVRRVHFAGAEEDAAYAWVTGVLEKNMTIFDLR